MQRILVTNDDGIDSPALVPLVRSLSPIAHVDVVVPDGERSWIGKAITRHETIEIAQVERQGLAMTTANGTPADCTNLAIHGLLAAPPDLVVSGINIGLNHGYAFTLSSGTIGAAAEAAIAGIPALAVSLGPPLQDPDWPARARRDETLPLWREAGELTREICEAVWLCGWGGNLDLLSVNIPEGATRRTARAITSVAEVRYERLFRSSGAAEHDHDFAGLVPMRDAPDPPGRTDFAATQDGLVSLAPIRLAVTGELDPKLADALLAGC